MYHKFITVAEGYEVVPMNPQTKRYVRYIAAAPNFLHSSLATSSS